ncbi:MAG: hypothetical protein LBE13_17025 [Bacteroidales bacterium]|nr:hypothetical protein [Bacteroidales bacterium]
MKRSNLLVIGLTVIGIFGIAFVFQTNSWNPITPNHVNEVTVGSCGETITPLSVCVSDSSSCPPTGDCVGFQENLSWVDGFRASSDNEGAESYTNGDLDCPDITRRPCILKSLTLPNGSVIWYCGPSDQSISVPNGTYSGINGSC